MAKVEKDYEDLLRLFNRHKVKYCIVGAYAVAFHSVPRYTKDMDIFIETSAENAKRIILAIKDFGFRSLRLTEKDFLRAGRTIQLGYEPVRVDLVTSIDGCRFEEVWKHRARGSYGKTKVFFIHLKDLIKNKKASHRKQDLADLLLLKKS